MTEKEFIEEIKKNRNNAYQRPITKARKILSTANRMESKN